MAPRRPASQSVMENVPVANCVGTKNVGEIVCWARVTQPNARTTIRNELWTERRLEYRIQQHTPTHTQSINLFSNCIRDYTFFSSISHRNTHTPTYSNNTYIYTHISTRDRAWIRPWMSWIHRWTRMGLTSLDEHLFHDGSYCNI